MQGGANTLLLDTAGCLASEALPTFLIFCQKVQKHHETEGCHIKICSGVM